MINHQTCKECGCTETISMECDKPAHTGEIERKEDIDFEINGKECCHCLEYSYGYQLL